MLIDGVHPPGLYRPQLLPERLFLEALPQCLAEGGKAEPPITAQNYLMERLREIGLVKT